MNENPTTTEQAVEPDPWQQLTWRQRDPWLPENYDLWQELQHITNVDDWCARIAEIARRDDGTCRTGKEILNLMTFITER